MLTSDQLLPRVLSAFGRLLTRLDAPAVEAEPTAQVRAWSRLKAERGGAALAAALGLHEAELAPFEAAARDLERTARRRAESPAEADERNAVLAQVRLLSWLETVAGHVPGLLEGDLEAPISVEVGHKQVRALELIVRRLITESYGEQEKLLARLREALSERVVSGWVAKADPGDILSGLTFSELASLFVDKNEFTRYEGLYEDTSFLTLLKQRRKTIQSFLDDVRRIRNALAHNKRVSNTQLTLLDLYYEEIVNPVQAAHDQGETQVDPGTYLDVGREDLERWVGGLKEDMRGVRDDLAELRAELGGAIAGVKEDTTALRAQARGIDRKVIAIGVGVAGLLVAAFFLLNQGGETQEAVEQARTASERTGELATDAATASREAAGTSREAAAASREATAAATGAESAATAASDEAAAARAAAERTEAATREAAERSEAAARAAAEQAAASTERIARSLDDLKDGFAALLREGGTIVEADRPEAHYHNARVYEQRGDTAKAMESYRRYFATTGHGFVDPHLRYQALLKLQNGLGGAREIYFTMKEAAQDLVTTFAWTLLLEPEARAEQLAAFTTAHPDYAPAWYERSRDVSLARLGRQSLEDKRQEKEALERFLALAEQSAFLSSYLDQQVASQQLEDARERLAAVGALAEAVLENPVTLSAMQSNAGWGLTFIVSDEAQEILWRRKGQGEFKSTGHQPNMRTASGLPMPVMYVPLSDGAPGTFEVKYVDAKGRENGPYELVFDPAAQQLAQTKSILDMTANSWVAFRDWEDGVLLYFTHLVSHRGSLKEVRYSLDSDALDRRIDLPPSDPRNPYAMPDDYLPYVTVPKATRYVLVQVTYADGTTSEAHRFDR